jgi:hypothetical protein
VAPIEDGVALMWFGAVLLADRQALFGVTAIGFGLAAIGLGVIVVGPLPSGLLPDD